VFCAECSALLNVILDRSGIVVNLLERRINLVSTLGIPASHMLDKEIAEAKERLRQAREALAVHNAFSFPPGEDSLQTYPL
jgi:hypothetical protein